MVQRGGRRGPWLPDHLVQPLRLHIPCLLDVQFSALPPAHSAPGFSAPHAFLCAAFVPATLPFVHFMSLHP